jgi:exodeoxyribonuclease-5
MNITLSPDQRKVLREIWKWFVGKTSPSLTFGGYAGTGKTTMLAFFRTALQQEFPKLKVALCSYTGKAARVLEHTLRKHQAYYPQDISGTIHSLIYEPETDSRGRVISWRKRKKLVGNLIIVDEASMIDREIWADLRSFDIPILAVGDHGQLPPIHGDFNLMENPDLRLERIHRQAHGNPIIKLSAVVRGGRKIPYGDFGAVKKFRKKEEGTREIVEDILSDYTEDLLALVGYNRSRVTLNQAIREIIGMEGNEPQIGDRIICLRNNHRKGIYNGMLGKIVAISPIDNKKGEELWYDLEAEMDDGNHYQGKVLKKQFSLEKTLDRLPGLSFRKIGDLFDFGYVLTVHKAQGSQARKVLLFEERFKHMDDAQWHRWLYTAVTRAEEELVIVG